MLFIRFLLRFIALIISAFGIFPFVVLSLSVLQKINQRKLQKKVLNNWSKLLCFVCGLKLETRGNIQENPVFLVANHVSWLDIPVIHSYKLAGFVAKYEISKWPLLGWAVRSGETVFINRGKHDSRKVVLETIKGRLKQGRSIAVFPEGTATNGEYLGRFHRQLMQAAIETKTPMQAIAIKFLNKDGKRNKKIAFVENENFLKNVLRILSLPTSRVELTFCDVINTKDKTAKQVAMLSEQQVSKVLTENDYL